MRYNAIKLKAYNGATEVKTANLDRAQDVQFVHCKPGGMCIGLSFYLPANITIIPEFGLASKVEVYNSINLVWEGYVTGITPTLTETAQGFYIRAAGAWAQFLMTRKTLKPWADTRVGPEAWLGEEDTATEDFWQTEQNFGHVEIYPKETAFTSGDYYSLHYVAPTGQTVKRIKYDYDFAESTQQWEQLVWDTTGAAAVAGSSITATATGSHDLTLATPRQQIELRMYARANQNAAFNKFVKAEWENLVVYTETGDINAQEITKDIAALVTELSADLTKIGALTIDLTPFISNPPMTYADLLTLAAGTGDGNFLRWTVYVGLSSEASDSKPRLVLEANPALTDYDYAVRVDEPNVNSTLAFQQDLDGVRNWIGIQYQDASGRVLYVTPDDDANLKDTSSITLYGQREEWLTLNTTNLALAKNYARTYLAWYKLPQWIATGALSILGYIRGKNGQNIPSSEIVPGKRVKIENWLNDLSGTGLTFLISATTYNDANESCDLTIGRPDLMEFSVLKLRAIPTLRGWMAGQGR